VSKALPCTMGELVGKVPGFMWRSAEEIIDEIGLAPLDLIAEIQRLEGKVQLAYQMANHFDGNSRVQYADGTISTGPVAETWGWAAKMLRGTLDDRI
jgi:hypothetical protein